MAEGSEHMVDYETGAVILNDTTVPDEDIMEALKTQHPEFRAIQQWTSNFQAPNINRSGSRYGGIFDRDRYLTPDNIFAQFKTAKDAAENDDTVSGVLETTEALAFSSMAIECDDEDEEDIWNQILDDMNLDHMLRAMWREQFTTSQFYAITHWGTKTYKVRGTGQGGRGRKKQMKLTVPKGITLIDPLKVVPVGNFAFGQERLVYIADNTEAEDFDKVLAGKNTADVVVRNVIEGRHNPSRDEKKKLVAITGKNCDNLYFLNPDKVWRHTDTRPSYERFANCRMKSVFEILDLKQQLRQMDRAYLIGGTNFIVLVKKGSDEYPAKPAEINALASQVRATARVPVIVGDHRLEIEIITPKLDNTLKPERYNTLDARITARLYQMFMTGNYAAGAKGDDSIKLARVVARGIESRRHMLRKSVEKHVLLKGFEKNADKLTSEPKLLFHPKRIALDFDQNVALFMQDLADRGHISRDTLLSEFDFDQSEEARKREREADHYDEIMAPRNVPFGGGGEDPQSEDNPDDNSDEGTDPRRDGRNGGGNNNGGGMNRDSKRPNNSRPTNNSPARRRDNQQDKNKRESE